MKVEIKLNQKPGLDADYCILVNGEFHGSIQIFEFSCASDLECTAWAAVVRDVDGNNAPWGEFWWDTDRDRLTQLLFPKVMENIREDS